MQAERRNAMPALRSSAKTPSVLIADDDPMVRLLARSALEQMDLVLDEASNGAEAVARFSERPFELVLLDLEMPVVDGFAACAKIRALPGGASATLLVVTGLDDFKSIQRAYELGATDFITKPINWPLLIQRMHYVLRARDAFEALRESEDKLYKSQQIAHLGHWDWDVKRNRAEWSPQVYELLGRTPQTCNASYAAFLEAVYPQERAAVNRVIGDAIERGGAYSLEHRIVLPDGRERTVVSQGKVLREETEGTLLVRNIIQDVSARKDAEERIFQLAFYDNLTGLPNRDMFIGNTRHLLRTTQGEGRQAVVMLLDLDRFKRINDSLGHTAGDELLKAVARRFANYVLQSDLIAKIPTSENAPYVLARSGGDEFMLLIPGLASTNGVAGFAQHLLVDLSRPLRLLPTEQQELFVSASIGIALYPNDGENLETLLGNADAALGSAREASGGCFRFYARDMNQQAIQRLDLETRLNRALSKGEFQLYYQPQITLASGRLAGFEALLRWYPQGADPVPPNVFIPIAEETGMISEIGAWVLNQACRQLASWKKAGHALVPVAVNLSAHQFISKDLVETVMQGLSLSGVSPQLLELELTERIIMRDVDETRAKLMALSEIGVKLSVDDFGTGYSSMSYLKYFPLDALKIDRSFIQDIETDPNDESIVCAIVALSKGLGLSTVAEGVESDKQREMLTRIGCDVMQGYLVSRPVPAEEAAAFFSNKLNKQDLL